MLEVFEMPKSRTNLQGFWVKEEKSIPLPEFKRQCSQAKVTTYEDDGHQPTENFLDVSKPGKL